MVDKRKGGISFKVYYKCAGSMHEATVSLDCQGMKNEDVDKLVKSLQELADLAIRELNSEAKPSPQEELIKKIHIMADMMKDGGIISRDLKDFM